MDRQLLNRATDSSDAPTPGYMYIDIAKNAASSPMTCSEVATFLTRKLENKQNANIKWKCLKVITKTAESVPRGQFKRAVAQDQSAVAAIRLATNFRGPPDPVRGDEPYNRVRVAAKECLDIIYSDTPASEGQSPFNSGAAGGMSNTYGAPPNQQSSYGAGSLHSPPPAPGTGRRMEGIGNPMFSDPRNEPQPKNNLEAIIKDVGESFVGMIKDPLARNADVRVGGHGEMPRPGGMQGYGGGGVSGSYGRPPPGRNELAHATGGQWTMASNRGPNAVGSSGGGAGNDAYYKSREQGNNAFNWAHKDGHGAGGGVGGSWASSAPSVASQARQSSYADQHSSTPSITVNSAPGPSINHGGGGTAVSDGSYEKNLIMELCPPGGMKPVPPPDKLLSFSKSIPNLNPDLICPVLLDCLEEGGPWIMRAKALCVMETCIKAGRRHDNTNAYANFFYTCREEIEPLASHSRAAIRDPAKRVLALLGIAPSEPAAPAPASAPPAPPAVNLLDFDDEPASAPPAAPPSAPPPPPTQSSSQGGSDMFGGMQLKGSAPAAAAPPAQAPVAPPTSGNLLDELNVNDTPTPAPTPAKPAEVIDMFGHLSVKSNDTADEKKGSSDGDDLGSLAAAGSAFGFINDSSSQSQQQPSKESFDPMSNFSPNTQRQMMQVSQEQMQAMAYQQMMMQQQMQQQMQMQMAMAMQQGGGMPRGGMQMMPGMQMQRPGVMGPHAGKTSSGFSFLDNPATKKVDHSFDFVQDAIKTEKTHK